MRESDGLSSISSFNVDNQSNSKKKHECRSIMYVMLDQRLSAFKNQRNSQTRTPGETKHKLRQVNKNKWEFEIDTVVKFMIIESKTNVDFIVPSSLEVVFEQLIENDYNTLPRSC